MNKDQLKTLVKQLIKTNYQQQITGSKLQYVLLEIINVFYETFQISGGTGNLSEILNAIDDLDVQLNEISGNTDNLYLKVDEISGTTNNISNLVGNVGSKTVNESNIGNKRVLTYNTSSDELIYEDLYEINNSGFTGNLQGLNITTLQDLANYIDQMSLSPSNNGLPYTLPFNLA